MKKKLSDKELQALPRNQRIEALAKNERKVFDILVECPDLRETKYELVYEYYQRHIRFTGESLGDFEQDFLCGRVQVETINVAQRKCKRWFPELGPKKNQKSWQCAADAHLTHARKKTNPAQGELF